MGALTAGFGCEAAAAGATLAGLALEGAGLELAGAGSGGTGRNGTGLGGDGTSVGEAATPGATADFGASSRAVCVWQPAIDSNPAIVAANWTDRLMSSV